MKEQWKQDIRQRLADFEQPAPELQWDEIFRAVDAQKAARRHKTVVLWQRMAVAASVAALLAGGAVYLSQKLQESDGAKQISVAKIPPKQTNEQKQNTHTSKTIQYNNTQYVPSTSIRQLVACVSNFVKQSFTNSAEENPALLAENTEVPTTTGNQATTEEQSEVNPTKQEPMPHTFVKTGGSPQTSYHNPYTRTTARHPDSNLTAKAYIAGALGNTNSISAMGLMSSASSDQLAGFDASYMDNIDNSVEAWIASSVKDRQVKHHQPLRLGVSLRYNLNDRWSLEGGISYSHHASDITETAGNFTQYRNQELTFIGVPVNANYSIWSNRYVNVYASAGGEVERMVKGKAHVTTTYAGETNEQHDETVKMSRPVFSVNAAIGIEAKLGETFSLYAEPGVGYHFKNGSDVVTIYNDKPCNANLNLGVRFTLK